MDEVLCLLCKASLESHDRLFFECPIAKRVWRAIMELSLQCNPKICWEKIVNWAQSHWKGKNLKAVTCKLGLSIISRNTGMLSYTRAALDLKSR